MTQEFEHVVSTPFVACFTADQHFGEHGCLRRLNMHQRNSWLQRVVSFEQGEHRLRMRSP